MRIGVGHDAVGAPERPPVDDVHDTGSGRPTPEALPVVDDRVEQRDERIEDDGPSPRDPLRGGHVEVAGIADDQRIGVALFVP